MQNFILVLRLKAVMLKRRPCRLQTVQTVQTSVIFFYLYLNFSCDFLIFQPWPLQVHILMCFEVFSKGLKWHKLGIIGKALLLPC